MTKLTLNNFFRENVSAAGAGEQGRNFTIAESHAENDRGSDNKAEAGRGAGNAGNGARHGENGNADHGASAYGPAIHYTKSTFQFNVVFFCHELTNLLFIKTHL